MVSKRTVSGDKLEAVFLARIHEINRDFYYGKHWKSNENFLLEI